MIGMHGDPGSRTLGLQCPNHFRAGPLGMGHVLITVQDIEGALTFYRDLLGFRISDYSLSPIKAYFLHANPRHHSIALVEAPVNVLNHLMVELYSLDDVGQGYDLALTDREKIVATASDRMIVIADDSKWVETLGRFPLPVEVVPFGLAATQRAMAEAFTESGVSGPMVVRKARDGHVFVTDGGHWIVDVHLGRITDPPRLAGLLAAIPGVVEHGLFIGVASTAMLAGSQGIRVVERR